MSFELEGRDPSSALATTYKMSVNSLGEAGVVTDNISDKHSRAGLLFNIITGRIQLTTSNPSALAYLENNEQEDLVLQAIVYIVEESNISGVSLQCNSFRNPDSISTATPGRILNLNHRSTEVLDNVTFTAGAEGATLTGGTQEIDAAFQPPQTNVLAVVGGLRLPRGTSIGVVCTPPAGNTSMWINVAFIAYLEALATRGTTVG